MLKGIHKNIVFLSELDSELFEEAIFILRPKQQSLKSPSFIESEAEKIISSYSIKPSNSAKIPSATLTKEKHNLINYLLWGVGILGVLALLTIMFL